MRINNKFAAVAVSAAVLGGSMASAAPAQAAGQCVDYNYSQGGYASCVGYIQQLLNFEGTHAGWAAIAVDNQFGPATRNTVITMQRYWGLTVDGIVGAQTWRILCGPQMGPGPVPGFPYAAARAAGCNI